MKKKPKALLLNPAWLYADSTETAQPGYLRRKFAAIIKAQKPALPPVASVVRKLRP